MIQKAKRKRKKPLYLRLITNRKFIFFIAVLFGLFFFLLWLNWLSSKGIGIDYVKVDFLSNSENKALKKYPNAYHLDVVKRKGIKKPFQSKEEMLKDLSHYINAYDLVKIDDNRYYEVPFLSHSLPYLKSEAKVFLDDLGKQFQETLNELGLKTYRFSVTSILRTLNDQKGLRKTNVNATDNNSSHYYGLTIDLSQTRFFEKNNSNPIYSYRLRNLLLRELIQLQDDGRCYVLLENQTKCIHITVIN